MTAPRSTSAARPTGSPPASRGWTRTTRSRSAATTTPHNTHHGLLLVNNDDVVAPGTGFETHPHRDMEIVTWVLRGSLVHQDSTGHAGVIYPGLAQRMSAGTGILHSRRTTRGDCRAATRHTDPVHFVQMWVVPDEDGIEPGYAQREIDADLLSGALVPVASGMPQHGDSAIRIANRLRDAARGAARARAVGDAARGALLHLFVARGDVTLRAPARWRRATPCGSPRPAVSGSPRRRAAEILVWEMHATLAAA